MIMKESTQNPLNQYGGHVMYCPNCGNELTDDCVFCPYCGSKVAASQKPKFILPIIIIAAILVIGAVGWLVLGRGGSDGGSGKIRPKDIAGIYYCMYISTEQAIYEDRVKITDSQIIYYSDDEVSLTYDYTLSQENDATVIHLHDVDFEDDHEEDIESSIAYYDDLGVLWFCDWGGEYSPDYLLFRESSEVLDDRRAMVYQFAEDLLEYEDWDTYFGYFAGTWQDVNDPDSSYTFNSWNEYFDEPNIVFHLPYFSDEALRSFEVSYDEYRFLEEDIHACVFYNTFIKRVYYGDEDTDYNNKTITFVHLTEDQMLVYYGDYYDENNIPHYGNGTVFRRVS